MMYKSIRRFLYINKRIFFPFVFSWSMLGFFINVLFWENILLTLNGEGIMFFSLVYGFFYMAQSSILKSEQAQRQYTQYQTHQGYYSRSEYRSRRNTQYAKQEGASCFGDELSEALRVFSLNPQYSKRDVNEKFKELMLAAHPDIGGSHEKAIKVNAARDVLLKHIQGAYV